MTTINLDQMTTETRNEKTMQLDTMSVHDFVTVMNAEDQTVAQSVSHALPAIEAAIETITTSSNAVAGFSISVPELADVLGYWTRLNVSRLLAPLQKWFKD